MLQGRAEGESVETWSRLGSSLRDVNCKRAEAIDEKSLLYLRNSGAEIFRILSPYLFENVIKPRCLASYPQISRRADDDECLVMLLTQWEQIKE